MYFDALKNKDKIFAVAPMMDWTDRHCRYFHRLLSNQALLYTEMVVADALIHGDVPKHLAYDDTGHPIAVQLGGSQPEKLITAAKICADWGYDEINLNVGCPSDRVQSGAFGACLMKEPELVAQCVEAMKNAVSLPVTVKCRIGVDDQDPELALNEMAVRVFERECDALWVHARKAWLQGLSPKQNRDIPPLNYDLVHQLKGKFPNKFIGINGGFDNLIQANDHLIGSHANTLDGLMIGRAAYQNPGILAQVDELIYGQPAGELNYDDVCSKMMAYTANHIQSGGRANHVTRHMIGLFQGQAGAKRYRQILTVEACKPRATEEVISRAFAIMGFGPDANADAVA